MQILHSIPSLVPESGGTARVVNGLATALAENAIDVDVLTLELGSRFGAPLVSKAKNVHTTFVRNRLAFGQRQLWAPDFRKTLRQLIKSKNINLIHDHCIWLPTHLEVTRSARHERIPLVLSTHGMLEPWALNHNRFRKQLMWHLYQANILAQVDMLHATATSEAENLRNLGLRKPIVVIPNGVELPPAMTTMPKDPSRPLRTILFLSRIHPKKGLLNFIQALTNVRTSDWQVLIAGPDEGHHLREVQEAVAKSKLHDVVQYIGPVDDVDKWKVYQAADLFVLPSFSENFGIVVAEALACGVPVITTTGTPWQVLNTTHSGWWIEPTVEALVDALQEAMSLTDETRWRMGQNGRQLIQQNYDWDQVAAKMLSVYQWLLGHGSVPDCVYL